MSKVTTTLTRYWCGRCSKVSISSGLCGSCMRDDETVLMTKEYAQERLADLVSDRATRRVEDRAYDMETARCPTCNGRRMLRKGAGTFRTNGGVRSGPGGLAGQPRNLTGATTRVHACACVAKDDEVQAIRKRPVTPVTRFIDDKDLVYEPGPKGDDKPRPAPARAMEIAWKGVEGTGDEKPRAQTFDEWQAEKAAKRRAWERSIGSRPTNRKRMVMVRKGGKR